MPRATNKIQQPRFTTILGALRFHSAQRGSQTAFTFLRADGERDSLTFAELERRSQRIARALLDKAGPGDRALLVFPPGLDFIATFLGCLQAGIIAVPAYAPRTNSRSGRTLAIARDCTPRLLLCTTDTSENAERGFASVLDDATTVSVDALPQGCGSAAGLPAPDPGEIAFLQYTSGSTGKPNGVMVTYRSLAWNLQTIENKLEMDSDSVFCSWLPTFHDMGLIGCVLGPLYAGCHATFMSPAAFVSWPIRWLRAIDEFRATHSGGPNFGFEHCSRLLSAEQLADLDLTSWKVAFNGSEPVRPETLRRFAALVADCGFRPEAFFPSYGLAEATLFVAAGPIHVAPRMMTLEHDALAKHRVVECTDETALAHAVVSCWRPPDDFTVRIVDPDTQREVPAGMIGEIWLRGPSIAAGYWHNREATEATFGAVLEAGPHEQDPYLRTGDLGFLDQDELFITGRLKDLIIIRGANIYPQDIETLVEQNLDFARPNSVAAFAVETATGEELALVIEASRELYRLARRGDLEGGARLTMKVLSSVRGAIQDQYEIWATHVAFLPPGAFPRTSSGKLQRSACKQLLFTNQNGFLSFPGLVTHLAGY